MIDADKSRRHGWGGFGLVVLSALCYSSLPIFGKVAFAEKMSLVSFLSTRFTIASVLLWVLVLGMPRTRRAISTVPVRHLLAMFLCGILGYAVQSTLFFSALESISASLTEVLLYTCPAFLALIVWVRTGRPPSAWRLAVIGVAIAGVVLCVGPLGERVHPVGVALGLGAGFWFAVFMLSLDRWSAGVPGLLGGALVITGATVAFDLAALLRGGFALPPTTGAWAAVLGMVTIPTVLGFVTFLAGLKRVGTQLTSILSTFEPLGTLMLATVFLGERLSPTQWGGAVLIISAALMLAAAKAPREQSSPAGGAASVSAPD